ncbi:hypothetical protein EDD86DRAFT_46274 [Gorgonomyces haynaldii]|nr:hypothetical protein EDD86DRAFT_46274 [Gorgonomyces haynaldii]
MQQEQIQVPLKFPDFDQYELVYYRPDTTLIIVRAREIAYPNRRVILKSILVHSPEMNANLQYEFDVLCRVRQYHTAGNVLPGRRQSSQLTTIEDESAVRLSAHGSWKGPASIKNASDCLPFPLEIRQLDDCNVLIYLDLGGISIRQLYPIIQGSVPPQREPMPLEQILEAGIQVSQALELVHRAHTIHQDVNPNNILLWRDQQQNVRAQLIDFDMAIKFEEIQVSKTPEMNGTLPYMSPEQTGRVERSVDYRTDFYSLGVTLWELLIGRQPFYDDDATQVIYAHLARHPDSPSEVNPRIPSMISRIVLKLMKKDPADRYQSASAVTFDLTRCLDIVRTYRQSHNLTKKEFENADWSLAFEGKQFEIATEDICNTLKISKKLIGRDAELSILYSLFRETASGKMHGRIVVLNGAAGVGKQSLVNAVAKNALDMGMVTLISDIPPEKNALPFAHVLYVMEQMMRSVLSRQADKIRDWETAISSELGLEGITVLTQILPLTSNLFKQPRTEAVAPEKLNIDEVYRVVEIFLRSFTSKITPIAIYLPKVLYTPEMTGLLKYLVTKEIPYLLLIVHFKRGTVSLDADEKEEGPEVFVRDLGRKCTSLEIMPLQYLDVKQFLEGCMKPSPVDCADLVNVLLKKTKGNPLALLETTKLCETAGYISFDENLSHWTWSVPAIEKSIELSGSIADYLVSKLKTFDGEALYLLRCAGTLSYNSMHWHQIPLAFVEHDHWHVLQLDCTHHQPTHQLWHDQLHRKLQHLRQVFLNHEWLRLFSQQLEHWVWTNKLQLHSCAILQVLAQQDHETHSLKALSTRICYHPPRHCQKLAKRRFGRSHD